jgi:outer membrane immunogenic protein
MRRLVRGLLLAGVTSPVFAADIDNSWLRGSSGFPADPPSYRRWNGAYGGGQVGADFHSFQFTDNGNAAVASMVATDPILVATGAPILSDLRRRTASGLSYGGFAGYNYQIDDVVLGLEFNLNGSGLNVAARSAGTKTSTVVCPNPPIAGGNTCQITVNAANDWTGALTDYGTLRARGGWAYGSFLPYVVVGLAVGRVNAVQTVNVNYSGIITIGPNAGQNVGPQSYTTTNVSHGKAAVGFSAGLGIDYALYQNVFLRGEFEYLQFGAVGSANLNVTSLRTGVGVRF